MTAVLEWIVKLCHSVDAIRPTQSADELSP